MGPAPKAFGAATPESAKAGRVTVRYPLRDYGLAGQPLILVSAVMTARPLIVINDFWYVYVLVCVGDANRHYTGVTHNY